ncbi:MAG TPA: EamA family transporter [Candidatus Paceibacterota bacterium]
MLGIFLSFTTALLQSARDVYLSNQHTRGISHVLRAFLSPILVIPIMGAIVLLRGLPDIREGFFLYAGIHALLMVVANYCYMRSLAIGHLSETQPMLAFSPMLLLITTPLMTNDTVTPLGWIGVFLAGLGVYATQHPGRDPITEKLVSFWRPFITMWRVPGVLWMFGVTVIFSVAANLDKLSTLSADAPTYLLVDASLTALIAGVLILLGAAWGLLPRPSLHEAGFALKTLAPGGLISAFSGLTQMWALTLMPVPYVVAIKRLSIVFASLWGYFARRERAPHWYRIAGVVAIFFGIVLIVVFGRI